MSNASNCAALMRLLTPAFLMFVALGILRVIFGAVGVPESFGSWMTSGTLLSLGLAPYLGYAAARRGFRYRHAIAIGWVLSMVQGVVMIAAMLFTVALGLSNYFTSERVSLSRHVMGHLGS